MRHFTLLTVIGFLVGCTLVLKAENSTSINTTTISLLDLTDRDTTVSKVNPENDDKKKKKKKAAAEKAAAEAAAEEATIEITITLTEKQAEAFEEENMPSDDELEVIEMGIITPSTRYNQPSEDIQETMIMKIDDETGEEYFIRKSYAPSQFKDLQGKRKYRRRANKLKAKGMKSSS